MSKDLYTDKFTQAIDGILRISRSVAASSYDINIFHYDTMHVSTIPALTECKVNHDNLSSTSRYCYIYSIGEKYPIQKLHKSLVK